MVATRSPGHRGCRRIPGLAAPADVAIGTTARPVRPVSLHQRRRRRAPRDLARRLGVLLAPRRPSEDEGCALPVAHDGAARARRSAPDPAPRSRGPPARDLVRRGRGARRGRGPLRRAPCSAPSCLFPGRARAARPLEGPRHHEERAHLAAYAPPRGGADARERPPRAASRSPGARRRRPARLPLPEDLGRAGPHLPRGRRVRRLGGRSTCGSRARRRDQAEARRARSGPRGRIPELTGPRDRRRGHAGRERLPALPARDLAPGRRRTPARVLVRRARGGSAWRAGFLADLAAPTAPHPARARTRSSIACVSPWPAIGALLAFEVFGLPLLTVSTRSSQVARRRKLGRLAFQSLMQRNAPAGRRQGRVFVRYEVLFQLAWVAAARSSPLLLPIDFRLGILQPLGAVYILTGAAYCWPYETSVMRPGTPSPEAGHRVAGLARRPRRLAGGPRHGGPAGKEGPHGRARSTVGRAGRGRAEGEAKAYPVNGDGDRRWCARVRHPLRLRRHLHPPADATSRSAARSMGTVHHLRVPRQRRST